LGNKLLKYLQAISWHKNIYENFAIEDLPTDTTKIEPHKIHWFHSI